MVEWRPRGLRRPAHDAPLHRHARRLTLAWVAAACAVLGPLAGAAAAQPVNNTRPEVSGKPALGETLSCSTGTWSGTAPISYAYQWLRNGSPIGGATQSTYTIVEVDQGRSLACEVTASNAAGSRGQPSWNSVFVPASPPEPLTPPQVLGIAPAQVGESLTCLPGTWRGSPPPTFTYQ